MGDIKSGICAPLILALNPLVTDNCIWQPHRCLWHYKAIVTKDVIKHTRLNILWALQQAQCRDVCCAIQVRHFARKDLHGLIPNKGVVVFPSGSVYGCLYDLLDFHYYCFAKNKAVPLNEVKLQQYSFLKPVLGGI